MRPRYRFEQGWPNIAPTIIAEGISTARLTGRLERVSEQPLVLLDVAHNPHAARFGAAISANGCR